MSNIPMAEGVWVRTVTFSAIRKSWNSAGSADTDSGTTTNRPPRSSAEKISHTEKSKAYECQCDQACSDGRPASCAAISCVRF
ncbi:Uncharacterised protein [Mycobacteroides abscessus subsp. abscessus]|nr:Uncharacterised protein [Mycobacteroides abscessus subsp. abscessus]